jgi:large subunit ribosomal protein L11
MASTDRTDHGATPDVDAGCWMPVNPHSFIHPLLHHCNLQAPTFFFLSRMSFVRAVRLRVPAGSAKPGPAIGQALGPLGINMAQFCKDFNEKSETMYQKDTPLRVELRAMSDRTFTFSVRSPSTSWLVRQAAGVTKGPTAPNCAEQPSGYITPEAVYQIAVMKQADDNRWHLPLDGIARSVAGTARSIGIVVQEEENEEEKDDGGSEGEKES